MLSEDYLLKSFKKSLNSEGSSDQYAKEHQRWIKDGRCTLKFCTVQCQQFDTLEDIPRLQENLALQDEIRSALQPLLSRKLQVLMG